MEDRRQQFQIDAPCLRIAVTTAASAAVALPIGNDVRLVNEGPNTAFIAISTANNVQATVPNGTAAKTCTPLLAGEDAIFSLPDSTKACYISSITSIGTASVDAATGEGG